MPTPGPTIVVGGGIAGLLCARTLARAGREVLLLEREAAVGGRVRTTVRDGFRLDHGFQVLFTAYPTLASQLELPALNLRAFQPAARLAGGPGAPSLIGDAFADRSLLVPTILAGQLSIPDKLRMLRLRALAKSLPFDECFAPRFDDMSTRTFLAQRGFSTGAIESFFAPFYGGILLDRSLETSASVLLYTFKMLAEGRTAVPADGMGAITAQLAAGLPVGSVRTRCEVVRLLRDGDSVTGVVLPGGDEIRGSAVVLACEPPAAAALAQTARLPLLVPEGQLGCTTLYFRSAAALLRGTALWLNTATDATVSHAITISNVAPSYAPADVSLTAATILGDAATLGAADLVPRVLADLARMSPAAQPARAELLAIWRVPYSQFSQPPGSRDRRMTASTGLAGLFVASEAAHTSSLEGAARGGLSAAQAVLRDVITG